MISLIALVALIVADMLVRSYERRAAVATVAVDDPDAIELPDPLVDEFAKLEASVAERERKRANETCCARCGTETTSFRGTDLHCPTCGGHGFMPAHEYEGYEAVDAMGIDEWARRGQRNWYGLHSGADR